MENRAELIRVVYRNKFYEDSKNLFIIIVVLLGVACGLFSWFVYLQLNQIPEPKYFDKTKANQLIAQVPLDQPNEPQNVVLNWVTEVLTRAYSFNFSNMERIVLSIKPYFTEKGFGSYLDELGYTGRREWVVQDKLIATAVPVEAPIILGEGVLDGQYAWRIKLPLMVEYQGVEQSKRNKIEVQVLVARVPTTVASEGMRIFNVKTKFLSQYIESKTPRPIS